MLCHDAGGYGGGYGPGGVGQYPGTGRTGPKPPKTSNYEP